MKKVERSEFKRLPRTRLHLDEFWEIARLFKENCKSVEVTIDRFRLEDCSQAEIDEIRDSLRTPRVRDLSIHGRDPTVHLDLSNDWRRPPFEQFGLYLGDADDSTSLGLAQRVIKALPRRHLASLLDWKMWLLGMAATCAPAFLIHYAQWARHGTGLNALAIVWLLGVAVVSLCLLLHLRPGPVLCLEKRAEHKTVLSEYGQKLLWLVISNAVSLTMGFLFGKLSR